MFVYLFWTLTFFVKTINLEIAFIEKIPLAWFIPETYKIDLTKSLLFRCFSLCFDFIKIYREIDKLKGVLYKNS